MNFLPNFKGRQLFLPSKELPIIPMAKVAFVISMIASGVGLYAARKFNDYFLP